MVSQDDLLAETNLLPVKAHLGLICAQFLASASRATHPSNSVTKIPTGKRKGRKSVVYTLQSRFGHIVQPHLDDEGNLPEVSYKHAIKEIHTKEVTEEKSKLTSKALGTTPPDVSPEESSLPRFTRNALNQARSTYCKSLRLFQARIGTAPDDLCPLCRGAPHTTEHLWSHPRETADFLRTLPSFNDLPLNPLLTPPSPEPPPRAQDTPD
jgi:hypothetical protein